jgi:hypothetical protein
MTDSNTQKPAGFTAGGPSYAGQQPASFGERPQPGSQHGEPKGGELVEQAKTAASKMADQAKSVVRSRVSERASRSATEVGDFARALRQTGRQIEGNMASPLVGRAADQLDRVAEMLDSNDPDELVRNVERFARQQPLLFLGGAFALGLAGARFLKSSSVSAPAAGSGFDETGEPLAGGGEIGGFRP